MMFGPPGDMSVRTISQIASTDGAPRQATHTSNLWEVSDGVFGKKTEGNAIDYFTTGADYFKQFIKDCRAASDIRIIGWQINWDALLEWDEGSGKALRLYDLLRERAEKGANIYVMPWRHSNPIQTYDYQTETVLDSINDALKIKGSTNRVHIVRAETFAETNPRYYSHHQKQVVINGKIAYVGGIDLSYGRYDDAKYSLICDANGQQVMNRYNPCIPSRQNLSKEAITLVDPDLMRGDVDEIRHRDEELAKIMRGGWQVPYREAGIVDTAMNVASIDRNKPDLSTLDPRCQPRMPWQDVHCRIEGPAVADLNRNFVARWNSSGGTPLAFPEPPAACDKPGNAHIQVLRSAPRAMGDIEAKLKSNPRKSSTGTEDHIKKAMLRLIEKATSFIYIESQFFVSAFGKEVPEPDRTLSPAAEFINSYDDGDQNADAKKAGLADENKKLFWKDRKDLLAPPVNGVCKALIDRIGLAILDKQPFHVYITLPVHPEGMLCKASIAVQVYWTMQTIAHGSHSLLNGIRRAFKARAFLDDKTASSFDEALALADKLPVNELDQQDERWKDYVTLLNLRNWEELPGDDCNADRYVTEQIYVHSKLMIVDDLYALLGSANINDRSLVGEKDSEIAVLVMDGDTSFAALCGPDTKRPVRKFARELRTAIWEKLFGITGDVRPAKDLKSAIEAPASPKSWEAIQAQAEKNAAAYEAAFPFVPRNWILDKAGKKVDTAKIIPNWDPNKVNPKTEVRGYKTSLLPFELEFWTAPQHSVAGAAQLKSIQGFITALPVHWLHDEKVRFEFSTDLVTKNEQAPLPHGFNAQKEMARTNTGRGERKA